MLPFSPQPLATLQGRYAAALAHVFDCRAGVPRPRPGELYSNVFDSEDGMRLIISLEQYTPNLMLHVSASAMRDTSLFNQLAGSGEVGQERFIKMAPARF